MKNYFNKRLLIILIIIFLIQIFSIWSNYNQRNTYDLTNIRSIAVMGNSLIKNYYYSGQFFKDYNKEQLSNLSYYDIITKIKGNTNIELSKFELLVLKNMKLEKYSDDCYVFQVNINKLMQENTFVKKYIEYNKGIIKQHGRKDIYSGGNCDNLINDCYLIINQEQYIFSNKQLDCK